MLTGLWTIGIKVPDLEQELAFHQQMGNPLVLDETIELDGKFFRLVLVKMGDKYVHLAEQMVYEELLSEALPFGMTHLVYISDNFEADVAKATDSGAIAIRPVATVSAGFGERRVAFMQSPSGWIFEVIEIKKNLVPHV